MSKPKAPVDPVSEIVDHDPLGVGQGGEGNESTALAGAAATTTDATGSDASGGAEAGPTAEAAEIPNAPGDEPDKVFERRLDRLTNIVADAEFEGGSALGDLTTLILDMFKHRPQLWSAMSNGDQRDLIKHIEVNAKDILRMVVQAVATVDSQFVFGTILNGFTVKGDSIEAKVKVGASDDDTLIAINRLAGHEVVLISADSRRFQGRRGDIETMPDQLGMAFADDKPKTTGTITTPKPGEEVVDTNANGNDDDLADEVEDEEQGPWVVFDPSDKVYLTSDAQGDAWAEDISVATQFATRGAAESKAEAEQAEVQEFVVPEAESVE